MIVHGLGTSQGPKEAAAATGAAPKTDNPSTGKHKKSCGSSSQSFE
jgi:hypothetical protein